MECLLSFLYVTINNHVGLQFLLPRNVERYFRARRYMAILYTFSCTQRQQAFISWMDYFLSLYECFHFIASRKR